MEASLLIGDNEVVRESRLPNLINNEFHEHKGLGARRLKLLLGKKYSGLSDKSVQNVLSKSQLAQLLHVKFTNQAPSIPVRAKFCMQRLQVDLVDFSKMSSTDGNHRYRYVLSVLDVFSRYVWLRPLQTKSSEEVTHAFRKICMVFGLPQIVQHDCGKEFHGKFKKFLAKNDVTDISSSPYHPQSQGKVERFHRCLKRQILYDMIRNRHARLNWASNLPEYESKLNQAPKSVLGWQSPFNVFYGREYHAYHNRKKSKTSIYRKVFKASQRHQKAYFKEQERKLRTPIYCVGDNVLIRLTKGSSIVRKRKLIDGRITKRNLKKYRYKVKYEGGHKWFSVKDIMANTLAMQRYREASSARQRSALLKHLLKPITHIDHISNLHDDFGLSISYDPEGDGNCQFNALAHQLRSLGHNTSYADLRQQVVRHLRSHNYLGGQNISRWQDFVLGGEPANYLSTMACDGTYGDQITLQAVADLFRLQIVILSNVNSIAQWWTHI